MKTGLKNLRIIIRCAGVVMFLCAKNSALVFLVIKLLLPFVQRYKIVTPYQETEFMDVFNLVVFTNIE